MSNISVDNLTDSRELDSAKREEITGGFLPGMESIDALVAGTMLMSFDYNSVSQNATNINFVSGAGSTNAVGSLSTFNVNTGAAAIARSA